MGLGSVNYLNDGNTIFFVNVGLCGWWMNVNIDDTFFLKKKMKNENKKENCLVINKDLRKSNFSVQKLKNL